MDRIEQPQRPQRVDVARVLGRLEADLDVALRPEVVDLLRPHLVDQPRQPGGVGHVAVVEDQAKVGLVWVLVEVIDAARVDGGRAPDQPGNLIALLDQELSEVRAILTGDSGDKGTWSLRHDPEVY